MHQHQGPELFEHVVRVVIKYVLLPSWKEEFTDPEHRFLALPEFSHRQHVETDISYLLNNNDGQSYDRNH